MPHCGVKGPDGDYTLALIAGEMSPQEAHSGGARPALWRLVTGGAAAATSRGARRYRPGSAATVHPPPSALMSVTVAARRRDRIVSAVRWFWRAVFCVVMTSR